MPTADVPHKCICQICTCGRHRCPHRPGLSTLQIGDGSTGDEWRNSEYNEHYKDKGSSSTPFKREPLRRARDNLPVGGGGDDKLQDATTFRSDYVQQKGERAVPFRNLDNLRPEGDLHLNTSYSSEYDGRPTQRGTKLIQRDNLGPNPSAKFEAKPMYKDDYPTWTVSRPVRMSRPQDGGITPTGSDPFDGSTTQRSDFVDMKPTGRATMNRPRTSQRLEGDFAQGGSTFKGDYQGRPGEKAKPIVQQSQRGMIGDGEGPLQSTLHSQDYRPWDMRRLPERRRRPEEELKLSGDHDMNTTHKQDYTQKGVTGGSANVRTLRPKTATRIGSGDMAKDTTHRRAYVGHGPETERAKPMKFSAAPLFGDRNDPSEKTTHYRQHYIRHPGLNQPCPAEGLVGGKGTGNPNFRFRTEIGGHHFYAPMIAALAAAT